LAIKLAKKFRAEIISADSRQVYRDANIGTGKDLPVNSKFQLLNSKFGYYSIQGVRLWGYDLVGPKGSFSVGQYLKFARHIINDIQKRKKLPILVGGTGLYIKGVVDGIPTASIPRNRNLRRNLEGKSTSELYELLASFDALKAGSMNASDRKNPRRLVRAIEISQYLIDHKLISGKQTPKALDTLFIGLEADRLFIEKKIEARVKKRVDAGIKDEIGRMLKSGVTWNSQSMLSLGYRQWRNYFEGKSSEQTVIDEWSKEEKRYAKRQILWFKRDKRINWFDITAKDYQKEVEKMVRKWYSSENA
jgi:tRNA dimethylallyltransferase